MIFLYIILFMIRCPKMMMTSKLKATLVSVIKLSMAGTSTPTPKNGNAFSESNKSSIRPCP